MRIINKYKINERSKIVNNRSLEPVFKCFISKLIQLVSFKRFFQCTLLQWTLSIYPHSTQVALGTVFTKHTQHRRQSSSWVVDGLNLIIHSVLFTKGWHTFKVHSDFVRDENQKKHVFSGRTTKGEGGGLGGLKTPEIFFCHKNKSKKRSREGERGILTLLVGPLLVCHP